MASKKGLWAFNPSDFNTYALDNAWSKLMTGLCIDFAPCLIIKYLSQVDRWDPMTKYELSEFHNEEYEVNDASLSHLNKELDEMVKKGLLDYKDDIYRVNSKFIQGMLDVIDDDVQDSVFINDLDLSVVNLSIQDLAIKKAIEAIIALFRSRNNHHKNKFYVAELNKFVGDLDLDLWDVIFILENNKYITPVNHDPLKTHYSQYKIGHSLIAEIC